MPTDQQLDPVRPFRSFHEASSAVLRLLQERIGLDLWLVTRTEGEDWIVLSAEDRSYEVKAGDVFRWSDSFCSRMVEGQGPRVAPDAAAVPAYAEAPIGRQVEIGAYVGVPLTRRDGSLFGTLCAIDPEPQAAALAAQQATVETYARLLATILNSELERHEQVRRAERAEIESSLDPLSGVFNRRGWDHLLAAEEQRCRRYGNPAGVVVIDLDGLKAINDSQGHDAGDQLLVRAARVIGQVVRQTDVVARIGGDEFAVLAPEEAASGLEHLEARLMRALDEAGILASIGSARRDPRGTLQEAQKLADQRMYERKKEKSGRT